ncbi:MAG: hypothetical protein KAW61_09775, partial [candidate division Zixibacteria bacterium]|nr:hypothetical protein [candidate division Zixibacteria bacterium]
MFMRILITVFFFWGLALMTMADVPQMINYQGRLTDSLSDPVPDGDYEVTFEIWNDRFAFQDTLLWTSGPQTVTVQNGLFTYNLGSAETLPLSLFTRSAH